MPNQPFEFPIFTPPDKVTVAQMWNKIVKYMRNDSGLPNINPLEITMSSELLEKVIEKVERQRIFYHVFDNGHQLDRVDEGALFCYWITMLQPFSHPIIDKDKLNTKIAIRLLFGAIYFYCNDTKKTYSVSNDSINNLYKALMGKEIKDEKSLLLFARSLVI